MIRKQDIITIHLDEQEVQLARYYAEKCVTNGHSHVRSEETREETCPEDQLTGQLGSLAIHLYLFGGLERYKATRHEMNKHPYDGDCGEDITGANIDVKASRMRTKLHMSEYYLSVAPKELREGWVYVQALVPDVRDDVVHLMGWAMTDMLTKEPVTALCFKKKHILVVTSLNPLMPIRWYWS